MHGDNSFITLTYADPGNYSLNYKDFQKFMKRLRKKTGKTIRFYMCGEYGKNQEDVKAGMRHPSLGRQHFHAILFGKDFHDRQWLNVSDSGEDLFRSAELEELWPHGFSVVQDFNFETAAYVARYVIKKIKGDAAEEYYIKTCPYTMNEIPVTPEFTKMSTRPGIGATWFQKYHKDVFPSDELLVETKSGIRRVPVPTYYTRLLKTMDEKLHDEIKERRINGAKKHAENNTYERLRDREYIQMQKLNRLEARNL